LRKVNRRVVFPRESVAGPCDQSGKLKQAAGRGRLSRGVPPFALCRAAERIHNACKKALISALDGPISNVLDALSGDAKATARLKLP
jgi:hypothetical protein